MGARSLVACWLMPWARRAEPRPLTRFTLLGESYAISKRYRGKRVLSITLFPKTCQAFSVENRGKNEAQLTTVDLGSQAQTLHGLIVRYHSPLTGVSNGLDKNANDTSTRHSANALPDVWLFHSKSFLLLASGYEIHRKRQSPK